MYALLLTLLIDGLDGVRTLSGGDEVAVVSVDRRPVVEMAGPDACSDAKSQPTLGSVKFGTVADAWPDAVDIEGVVTGLMPSYCGFACRAGVLRVHVTNAATVVRGRDVYVATWCIEVADTPKYCGRTVRFHAKKLYVSDEHCGLVGDDFFDSKEMPYYAVSDAEHEISIRARP